MQFKVHRQSFLDLRLPSCIMKILLQGVMLTSLSDTASMYVSGADFMYYDGLGCIFNTFHSRYW